MAGPNIPAVPKNPMFPNKWLLVTVVLGVLLLVSLSFNFISGGITGMAIGTQEAGAKAVGYLNGNLGVSAQLIGVNETNGMYSLNMLIQGSPYVLYMSKDGKLLFPQVFIVDAAQQVMEEQQANMPKSDKPSVELFVMSECPYGTQIEKGMLPVAKLLGGKIDFNIRFVYYAMHGEKEITEELNQYCIQKEQKDKYNAYLTCYLKSGNSAPCLTEAKIDTAKLSKCAAAADTQFDVTKNLNDQASWLSGRYPLFNVNKDLNERYQIGGSPVLIINGVESGSGRDSQSLLSTVCDAFNTKPSECSQTLSSATPSPGFGEGTGTDSSGQCG